MQQMKVSLIQIGNSKGVRIPKSIIQQCNFGNELDLDVVDGSVVIKSLMKIPRQGWRQSLAKMHEEGADKMLIDDDLDIDMLDV